MDAQLTKQTIDEQAARLGLRRADRLPREYVLQAYDLHTAWTAYIRRMEVVPDVYAELGGYVYVWKGAQGE